MFDYNKMIERAVKFFPTWSDIRKRHKTSNGGKVLGAVINEIQELETAIEEYKKYYFLDNYIGHEDEVVAFSYVASIGVINNLDLVKVKYNNEMLTLTEDINLFFANLNLCYYEDGKIYIREDIFTSEYVSVYVSDSMNEYKLSKISLWNIFDEFACFVGLERHNNETNSQLVKRILYSTRHKGNASIQGLRNSIVSELLSEFPELKDEDVSLSEVKIETVNGTNLREAYKNFNSLLDYLNSINRDVYRWKRWDIDVWQYDFKSLSYIPAKWDETITKYQNGIGYGNDLEVSIASNIQSTDANITLYKKEKEAMNKYLSNKNIKRDISFKFKKYNDILDSNNINYTIKASPMVRLNPNEITLSVHEQSDSKEEVPIEKIYKFGSGISIINNNNRIKDVYPYRLKFTSKNNNNDIKINKCIVSYINEKSGDIEKSIDLLREKDGFVLDALNTLSSNNIRQTINRVEHFNDNQSNGLENTKNNTGMICTSSYGYGVRSLYNMGGRDIFYNASCEMATITQASNIITINKAYCNWDKNDIVFNPDSQTKKLEIKLTANKFSFDVLSNNQVDVMVRYSKSGPYTIITKADNTKTWVTEESKKPRYMEVIISAGSNTAENVKIGNFKYSNYTISFSYKLTSSSTNNFILLNPDNMVLPMSNDIQLKVEINSKYGASPIIHGIYIGTSVNNTTYETDSFPTRNGCYRILEVECNCNMTLVKRDLYDSSDTEYTENYDPNVLYKSNNSNAYIRLDLSEYSNINNIIATSGRIQKIEESGVTYYNLLIEENQTVQKITIDGTKNNTAYTISLLELINRELSKKEYMYDIDQFDLTRDRLYCSRLVNGVVLLKNNENSRPIILTLSSRLLYGSNIIKYEFNNIPNDIEVKWGIGDGSYSDFITSEFEYIGFCPSGSKVHVANNSYELLSNEAKNVPIAENFTDANYYNPKALNFYTVEANTSNTSIKFYNYLDETVPFDELTDWSIGIKNLYIKNINNLNNESIYSVTTLDYTNKYLLNEYINLEDSYNISSNNTIYTEQYIVIPPEGMEVRYKQYDGTNNTIDLVKYETITIDDKKFKKLNFSNIDEILYIGTSPYKDGSVSNFTSYTLLNKEGIIIWDGNVTPGTNIYIKYCINKPVALVFDLNTLYKLTGYTVETYKELSTYKVIGMKNGDSYDLSNFKDYSNSDLAYIECSEPSFEGQMINNHIVKFNKHIEEKSVLLKTGYYYINGKEHYLFSEDDGKTLSKNSNLIYENVDISDDNIYTYKPTNNFIRNSEMLLRGMNDIYNLNCTKHEGKINFNKYTACESYNGWKTFNTTLELTDEFYKSRLESNNEKYEGFNNVCLKFKPRNLEIINYAYIDITNMVYEESYISIAATDKIKIYIGEEKQFGDLKIKDSLYVDLYKELTPTKELSEIRTLKFTTKKDLKYYMIVIGEGAIDDIVISNSLSSSINYHVKNVEKFGLSFIETKSEGTRYRMQLDNNVNCIADGASVCSDGNIRIVGNINWGLTNLKRYETREDFNSKDCEKDVELIIDDYIKTPKHSSGRFTTAYIEIDPNVINRIFFKVNDFVINNKPNVRVSVLTCDNFKFPDTEVITINSNYGFVYGKDLSKYVRIKIDIPEDYVVSNIKIYAEYRSDKDNSPIPVIPAVGNLISPIFDAQDALNYTVGAININGISNINDVEIYIRAMTDNNSDGIWSKWQPVPLTTNNGVVIYNKNSKNKFTFEDLPARFFQFKVRLISKNAYINLDNIEIEVKNSDTI